MSSHQYIIKTSHTAGLASHDNAENNLILESPSSSNSLSLVSHTQTENADIDYNPSVHKTFHEIS